MGRYSDSDEDYSHKLKKKKKTKKRSRTRSRFENQMLDRILGMCTCIKIESIPKVPRVLTLLQVLTSTYKLNLPRKALQLYKSLHLHHGPYHYTSLAKTKNAHCKASYKSLSFFQVSSTGWFHTFSEFRNH